MLLSDPSRQSWPPCPGTDSPGTNSPGSNTPGTNTPGPGPGPAGRLPRLAAITLLSALIFTACPWPGKYEDKLLENQVTPPAPKVFILTFERESDFTALAGRQVTVAAKEPAVLISPENGRGRTGPDGRLEIIVEPPAIYDRKALKGGDIVVDYPAEITVTLDAGQAVYEWDLDGRDSFARYSDPLYRGLDRDPDPSPLNLTLTIP